MNKLVFERGFYLLAACFLFSCSSKNNSGDGGTTPPPPPTPVVHEWIFENNASWTDEFNTDGAPDAAKWGYDVGGNGWGNNELQNYTNGLNDSISNGTLKIVAKKVDFSNTYTSARMVTKNKADWLY